MATIPESFPGVKPDTFYSSHEPFAINIISSTVCLLTLIVSVVTCAQGCSMGASVFRSVPGNSTFSQHLQQYQLDYKIPTDKSTPVSSSP